jgi:hypothetical protein
VKDEPPVVVDFITQRTVDNGFQPSDHTSKKTRKMKKIGEVGEAGLGKEQPLIVYFYTILPTTLTDLPPLAGNSGQY